MSRIGLFLRSCEMGLEVDVEPTFADSSDTCRK